MFGKLTALFIAIALPMFAADSTDSFNIFPNTQAAYGNFKPEKCNKCNDHQKDKHCERGPRGRRGPRGDTGATGATGVTGATGISAGSLIPFASGGSIEFSAFGVTGITGSAIAFGNNVDEISPLDTIDATLLQNMAFSVAGPMEITDITAYFSPTIDIIVGSDPIQIVAQVYISEAPSDNFFVALPGALVNFPVLNASTPSGTPMNASVSGLSIDVPANSRLLFVFYATSGFASTVTPIIGFASGGIRHQ